MDAALTIQGAGGTIVQQETTIGCAITPNLPSGLRIIMLVSEEDQRTVLQIGEHPILVTDLVTGYEHYLRRADCGLGCKCAVEFCT
jgi:hypothetical protein